MKPKIAAMAMIAIPAIAYSARDESFGAAIAGAGAGGGAAGCMGCHFRVSPAIRASGLRCYDGTPGPVGTGIGRTSPFRRVRKGEGPDGAGAPPGFSGSALS